MNPVKTSKKPTRSYSKSGITKLKGAVKALGGRVIDRRTSLGKALERWRNDLIADLGGAGFISTQQYGVIDLAVRTKLMLDSIDAWVLTQPSLINIRKKAILPVVRERTQLADSLAKYLSMLGLERRKMELDLSSALAKVNQEDRDDATKGTESPMNGESKNGHHEETESMESRPDALPQGSHSS